jgi:hypothetical protein
MKGCVSAGWGSHWHSQCHRMGRSGERRGGAKGHLHRDRMNS